MTFTETASTMRRVADAIDQVVKDMGDTDNGSPKPMLTSEAATGAAVMLCYIRDLVTCGDRDSFDRPTLLVILETISRDAEIFPYGVGKTIWAADDKE